jgi:hypothetical protein
MNEAVLDKRGPGRPPSQVQAEAPVKRGVRSWTPSNLGDVIEKEPGFRYRKVRKDDENIAKKREEGWEFVSGINSPSTKAIHPASRPDEPHKITSNVEGRDWIAMRLDEETAAARDAYHNEKSDRLERRIGTQTKNDLGKNGAAVHGSLVKERKGVRTIIE